MSKEGRTALFCCKAAAAIHTSFAAPAPAAAIIASRACDGRAGLRAEHALLTTPRCCPCLQWGPEVIGMRLRVYWPKDRAWYPGKIVGFEALDG